MSKTIIIQKNGVAQTMTVDKLRLPKAGGGTEDYLPADGKNLVKLEVKQNGTYKASDFGAYGIAEVKVKCTLNGGSATSKATTKAITALHHPTPAEGGLARTMSAHHLETPKSGGGTVQWVPEAEVALGTKSVNIDNRTYKASDDGKYGYSEFTVSGISITKDGNTVTHTDGTGTKTYILPHHIRVEHGPLKFTYNDGETIDFFDMLVKAYNEDNTVWTDETHPNGVIPLEELILPVTVADYSQTSGVTIKEWAEFGTGPWPQPINAVRGSMVFGHHPWDSVIEYDGYIALLLTGGDYIEEYLCCTDQPGTTAYFNPGTGQYPTTFNVDSEYTYDGKTVYYGIPLSGLTANNPSGGYNQRVNGFDLVKAKAAWVLVYGTPISIADMQTIPVQWARPWDAEILEDSFEIFVYQNPGYGGAEGGGGQTSGGGAGRDN